VTSLIPYVVSLVLAWVLAILLAALCMFGQTVKRVKYQRVGYVKPWSSHIENRAAFRAHPVYVS
jgi:hypothetical protein